MPVEHPGIYTERDLFRKETIRGTGTVPLKAEKEESEAPGESKVKTLFGWLRPRGDGVFICQDQQGRYFLQNKTVPSSLSSPQQRQPQQQPQQPLMLASSMPLTHPLALPPLLPPTPPSPSSPEALVAYLSEQLRYARLRYERLTYEVSKSEHPSSLRIISNASFAMSLPPHKQPSNDPFGVRTRRVTKPQPSQTRSWPLPKPPWPFPPPQQPQAQPPLWFQQLQLHSQPQSPIGYFSESKMHPKEHTKEHKKSTQRNAQKRIQRIKCFATTLSRSGCLG